MKKIIGSSIIYLVFLLINSQVNAQCSSTGSSATCYSYSSYSTVQHWDYWYVAPYTILGVSVYLESYGGYVHADIYTDGGTTWWDLYPNNPPVSDQANVRAGGDGYFELVTIVTQGEVTITANW